MDFISVLSRLKALPDHVEAGITDLAAKAGPLVAPLPTAFAVGTSVIEHLDWPKWVGVSAAIAVECLGLASVNTALMLREYNVTRRQYPSHYTEENKRKSKMKVDPPAPFGLAVTLAGAYLTVAIALAVVLDVIPSLATYSPVIFPLLSLTGATILALRADHRRRIVAAASQETSKNPPRTTPADVQKHSTNVQGSARNTVRNSVLDAVNMSRRERKAATLDAMLDVYRDNSETGATEIARRLSIGRSTVYTYLEELERAGKLRKNSSGWEVVA
jgi:predicted transcriptional regulator